MADPLIVFGPCKRKENSRFPDNGDPGPLVRNKKTKQASNATEKDVPKAPHRRPSVQGSEANDTNTSSQNTSRIVELVDGSDDEATLESDDKNPIDVDVEEDEESADDELGEYLIDVTRN